MVTFLDRLPETGALLALDVSRRRIGVAGSDPTQTLVTPLITIRRKRFVDDVAILARLCAEREVVALVVGLPLNMDGSIGPAAQSRRDVAARLMSDLALPVLLQDERLTTEAVRQAIEEGRLRRPKPGAPLDHHAAAVILEDALHARRATR